MNVSPAIVGLFTGLLLALIWAVGGFGAFLGGVVLGSIGYLVAGHLNGDFDVRSIITSRSSG